MAISRSSSAWSDSSSPRIVRPPRLASSARRRRRAVVPLTRRVRHSSASVCCAGFSCVWGLITTLGEDISGPYHKSWYVACGYCTFNCERTLEGCWVEQINTNGSVPSAAQVDLYNKHLATDTYYDCDKAADRCAACLCMACLRASRAQQRVVATAATRRILACSDSFPACTVVQAASPSPPPPDARRVACEWSQVHCGALLGDHDDHVDRLR
jgi:hypothetical protein